MFQKHPAARLAARRLAAIAVTAIALVGAAHAYSLDSGTFVANAELAGASPAAPGADAMMLGSTPVAGASAALSGSAPTSGGTLGGHSGPPPAPTPEPITMGVSLFGLGLAARRLRRNRN